MSTTDDTLYASSGGTTALTEPDVVSLATVTIWAYMIPHMYVEFAEYSLALERSRRWNRPDCLGDVRQAMKWAFMYNVVLGIVLYIGFSLMVSLLTKNLDRRMTDIVIGTSRIFAAVIFFILSINVPQWFGVYYAAKRKVATFQTLKEVRFNFSFALWKKLATMFFYNMFFSARTLQLATVYGILVGIAIGALLIYTVYHARHGWKQRKRILAVILIIVLVLVSSFTFLYGVAYISQVWVSSDTTGDDDLESLATPAIASAILLWPVLCAICHVAYHIYTKRKFAANATARFTSQLFMQNPTPNVDMGILVTSPQAGSENMAQTVTKDDDAEVWQDVTARETPDSSNRVSFVQPQEGAPVGMGGVSLPAFPSDRELDCSQEVADNGGIEQHDNDETLEEAQAPSIATLFRAKLYETYPYLCCCFKGAQLRNAPEPRLSYIIPDETSPCQTCWRVLWRLLWYLSSFFFLYLTIVNIGATSQQDTVKAALGPTFAQLYPPDYNNGTMCAWDQASPNATIKTFDTLQEVYDANWTVVHCGACGACSNWNDLSLQWTTRHELAAISKKCAQKSMFGSEEDVTKCNEETIGFLPACAECWTYDEIHTKNSCFWIYLQSIFIDAVADFSVGFNDITSATCDEALSGPVFVPCSGATRRRMGIVSSIPRPKYQQCQVIKQDWAVVFNHP